MWLLLGCGGPTRTGDLQVMSLASYQLLHPAMFLVCECKGTANSWNVQMFYRKNVFQHTKPRQYRHKMLNMCKKTPHFCTLS